MFHPLLSGLANSSPRHRNLRRRGLARGPRPLGGESLENRSLLAADGIALGEGGTLSWSAALETGRIHPVSPAHEGFTEAAKAYYSQQGFLFDMSPSTLIPNVPIQLGTETHEALLSAWPELDFTNLAVSAWQYDYPEAPVDLADNRLQFSVGVPGFGGGPFVAASEGILPVPHPSLVTTVSVELIDAHGNSRGWFLDSPAQGWHDHELGLGIADSQGQFKFTQSADFDIHQVVSVRMDAAATRVISLAAANQTELVHWAAWDHLRVDTYPTGSIHGTKFHDLNGNGQREDFEPGLAGFQIVLQGTDLSGQPVERKTVSMEDNPNTKTDETGMYWFENVPAGTYHVKEVLILPAVFPPLWVQSAPPSGEYIVKLQAGESIEKLDFGNYKPGTIQGFKYNDLNANGQRDWNEPGLAGWEIVLTSESGVTEAVKTMEDNPLTVIDEAGFYRFVNLRPGRYKISEVQQTGWKQSQPSEGAYAVGLRSGETLFENNFGNYKPAAVHGVKYEDINGNGKRDDNEPGIPGVKIVLGGIDGAGNPVDLTAVTMKDDPSTAEDEAGHYWLDGLTPGRYKVFEIVPDGWRQTQGDYGFILDSGQLEEHIDFGNYLPGSIHGRKTLDLNTLGKHESWEPGLAGWTIVLEGIDGQGNSVRRTTVTRKDDPTTDFDESGYYAFNGLAPGKYAVTEVLKPGWKQTDPSGSYRVLMESRKSVDGLDFLNASPYRCDLDGDGEVDAADMAILFANWGENRGLGNLNGDAYVDAADAGLCFREWTGDRIRPIDPVPVEPLVVIPSAVDVAFAAKQLL